MGNKLRFNQFTKALEIFGSTKILPNCPITELLKYSIGSLINFDNFFIKSKKIFVLFNRRCSVLKTNTISKV